MQWTFSCALLRVLVSVRLLSRQRCSRVGAGGCRRPCDRSPTVRFGSGRSPAESASLRRSPLRCGRERSRAWHLWWCSPRGASSRAFSVGARSRSRSSVRLEAPSSASVRGAFLRCGIPRLEKLASRREYDVSSPVASLNSTLAPPPASNSPSFSADAGNGGQGRGDGPSAKGREERQIGRTLTGTHAEGQKWVNFYERSCQGGTA